MGQHGDPPATAEPACPQVIFITEYVSSGSLKQFLKKTKKNHKAMNARVWGVGWELEGKPGELRESSGVGDSEWPRFRSWVAGGLRRLSSLLVPTRRSRASAARPGSAGVRRSCLHSGEDLALPMCLPPALHLSGAL